MEVGILICLQVLSLQEVLRFEHIRLILGSLSCGFSGCLALLLLLHHRCQNLRGLGSHLHFSLLLGLERWNIHLFLILKLAWTARRNAHLRHLNLLVCYNSQHSGTQQLHQLICKHLLIMTQDLLQLNKEKDHLIKVVFNKIFIHSMPFPKLTNLAASLLQFQQFYA